MGRDHTLFALQDGHIYITEHASTIRRRVKPRQFVNVLPRTETEALEAEVKQELAR